MYPTYGIFITVPDSSSYIIIMNGNRASGLRRDYVGPSLHDSNAPDQKDIAAKGDFRQASHTIEKIEKIIFGY